MVINVLLGVSQQHPQPNLSDVAVLEVLHQRGDGLRDRQRPGEATDPDSTPESMTTFFFFFLTFYLEAALDQVVVLSSSRSSLGEVLQQDEELLGQLLRVLLHRRQRELEQEGEADQGLGDHLRARRRSENRFQEIREKKNYKKYCEVSAGTS